jgi:hypothetical protein
VDDYGHPVEGDPVVTLVRGLVQPRKSRDVELTSEGGPLIGTHVVYLQPRNLPASSFIRFEPDNGDRYEVVGVEAYQFGRSPHLEVDARLIASTQLVEGS